MTLALAAWALLATAAAVVLFVRHRRWMKRTADALVDALNERGTMQATIDRMRSPLNRAERRAAAKVRR